MNRNHSMGGRGRPKRAIAGRQNYMKQGKLKQRKGPAFTGRMLGVPPVLGPAKVTAITYVDASDVRQFPLQNYGVWAIKMNDVYDPDPLIATGGITGYAELVAFYSLWLVTVCELDCTFVSNEPTLAVKVAVVLSPLAIAASLTTKALCLDAIERWGTIWTTELGETTGFSRAVMPKTVVIPERVVGDNAYYHAGTYNGATTTSPSSTVYCNFILTCAAGQALTNGVNYVGRFTYRVKFFRIQSTLLGSERLLAFLNMFYNYQKHYRNGEDVFILEKQLLEFLELVPMTTREILTNVDDVLDDVPVGKYVLDDDLKVKKKAGNSVFYSGIEKLSPEEQLEYCKHRISVLQKEISKVHL